MTSLSISELRSDISRAVKSAKKSPVTILKHGQEVAYLVSPSMYEEMLEALENMEDIAAYDKAKADGDEFIPWDQALKDLGLA
jgi:prevent-host-death family protein